MVIQPMLVGRSMMTACTGAYRESQIPGMTCSFYSCNSTRFTN
ncbi:hypothetical protein LINPERHAP1_LOCUS7594 [Linum perenne]